MISCLYLWAVPANNDKTKKIAHKEECDNRKRLYAEDRNKIREELEHNYINPIRHLVRQGHINKVIWQEEPMLITAIQLLATGHVTNQTIAFIKSLNKPGPDHWHNHTFLQLIATKKILKTVSGEENTYHSVDEVPSKHLDSMVVPKVLKVKISSKVMLLVNISDRLVNGLCGKMVSIDSDSVSVAFPGQTIKLQQ